MKHPENCSAIAASALAVAPVLGGEFDVIAASATRNGTLRRIENLRTLVARLSAIDADTGGPTKVLGEQIGQMLGYTKSGARKYIAELCEAGVIGVVEFRDPTPTYIGKPVYQISANRNAVVQFVQALEQPGFGAKPRGRRADKLVVVPLAGCHIHVLADDTYHPVRRSIQPVMRDPMVAALFGAGRAAAA